MNILHFENPEGVIASLGGQTAINLADPLMERGVKIIGTDCAAIDRAEDRNQFENLLNQLNIPRAKGKAVTKIEDGIAAAAEIGYPVLVRPSFVLGGRAMQIVANEDQLRHYLRTAVEIDEDKPVLVDKYIEGREVESILPSPSPTKSRASSCNTPKSWAWASASKACSTFSSLWIRRTTCISSRSTPVPPVPSPSSRRPRVTPWQTSPRRSSWARV